MRRPVYEFVGLALLTVVLVRAQAPTDWRAWMDEGRRAFTSGDYTDASEAFQRAVHMNPAEPESRFHLAVACAKVWETDRESNRSYADRAELEFRRVLIARPKNESALLWLGSLALQLQRLDDADYWYREVLASTKARDAARDASYALGVIAWSRWYPHYAGARRQLRMRPSDPGPFPDANLSRELRSRYGRVLEEGIQYLYQSLRLDENFANAAAYRSLILRERADIAPDRKGYLTDLRIAEDFLLEAESVSTAALELRRRLESAPVAIVPAAPSVAWIVTTQ